MSDQSFPFIGLSNHYSNINFHFDYLSSNLQSIPSSSCRNIIFPLLEKLLNSIKEYKKMVDFCIKELNDKKEKWEVEYLKKINFERKKFEDLEQNSQKEKEKWKDVIKKWEEAMAQIKIKENLFKNIEKEKDEQKLKMEEIEKNYKYTIQKLNETEAELEKERNMKIMLENKIEELTIMDEVLGNPPFPEFLGEKLLTPANSQEKKEEIEEKKTEGNEISENPQLDEQKLKMEEMEKNYKYTIQKLKETETELEKERNMKIMLENKIEERIIMDEILGNPPFSEFLGEKRLTPANSQEKKEEIEEKKTEGNEILQNSQLLLKPTEDKKNRSEEMKQIDFGALKSFVDNFNQPESSIKNNIFKEKKDYQKESLHNNSDTRKKEEVQENVQKENKKNHGRKRAPNLDDTFSPKIENNFNPIFLPNEEKRLESSDGLIKIPLFDNPINSKRDDRNELENLIKEDKQLIPKETVKMKEDNEKLCILNVSPEQINDVIARIKTPFFDSTEENIETKENLVKSILTSVPPNTDNDDLKSNSIITQEPKIIDNNVPSEEKKHDENVAPKEESSVNKAAILYNPSKTIEAKDEKKCGALVDEKKCLEGNELAPNSFLEPGKKKEIEVSTIPKEKNDNDKVSEESELFISPIEKRKENSVKSKPSKFINDKQEKESNVENKINEIVVDEYLLTPLFPEFLGEKLLKPIKDLEKMTEAKEILPDPQLAEFRENLLKSADSKDEKEPEEKMTEADEILLNPIFPEILGEKILKPTQDKEKQSNIKSKEDLVQFSLAKVLFPPDNELKSSEINDEEAKRVLNKLPSLEKKEVEEENKEREKEKEDEEKNKNKKQDIPSLDNDLIQTFSSGENIKKVIKEEKVEESTSKIVHTVITDPHNEGLQENVLKKEEKSVNEIALVTHPSKSSEAKEEKEGEDLTDKNLCLEEKVSIDSDKNNSVFFSCIESEASKVLRLNTIPEENEDNTKFLSFELNESKLLTSQIEEKKENPVEKKKAKKSKKAKGKKKKK